VCVCVYTLQFSSVPFKFSINVCFGLISVVAFGCGWMSERQGGFVAYLKEWHSSRSMYTLDITHTNIYIKWRSTKGWLCTFLTRLHQLHYRLSFVCNPSQANRYKLGTGLTIWSYISVIMNESTNWCFSTGTAVRFNPLSAKLNPICDLLALLAHHFLHVSRIRFKSLTLGY